MDHPQTDGFAVTIDRDADVPVGLQLAWALSARIQAGELQPEQRLPGLREMAHASGLNVNTVRAVYQRLEQRGLLESRQGSGTFVAPSPQGQSVAGTIAADAAREAEASGVSPREVAAALYVAMPDEDAPPRQAPARPAPATSGKQGVAQRRALRTQIAALERAIAAIEAEHPGVAPLPTATHRGPGPTLLSAEELEQVRSGLVHRLAAVQAAIDERVDTTATTAGVERSVQTRPTPARALARTRKRAHAATDNTPTPPDPDPRPDQAAAPTATPKRPARPRSAPRPATAGT